MGKRPETRAELAFPNCRIPSAPTMAAVEASAVNAVTAVADSRAAAIHATRARRRFRQDISVLGVAEAGLPSGNAKLDAERMTHGPSGR